MTWTRLSDTFTDRPDLLGLSRSARLLHIEALVRCNRMLTDGHLPRGALPRITDASDIDADVAELMQAGVWSRLDDGWQIDWTDQEAAESVEERRQERAEIQRRYRDRRKRHARGDHSMCTPQHCPVARNATGNATGNAASNGTGNKTSSRPDPSPPVPTDREGGRGRGKGAATSLSRSAGATPLSPASQPPRRGATPWELGIVPTITVLDNPDQEDQ